MHQIVKRFVQVSSLIWLAWVYLSIPMSVIHKEEASKQQTLPVSVSNKDNPIKSALPIVANKQLTKQSPPVKPSPETKPVVETASVVDDFSNEFHLEIQLSRRQVALYQGSTKIKSYPIAVGRAGWETPTGKYKVLQMKENPTWINPLTNTVIKGGDPKNPLGHYWIAFWTDGRNWIGFHGTPNPETVGRAASHGCIRMHNEDVEELFYQVTPGTIVTVKP